MIFWLYERETINHLCIVQIPCQTVLLLLEGGDLGVRGVDGVGKLGHSLLLLPLDLLDLVGSQKSFTLKAGLPLLRLGISLRELTLYLKLNCSFILVTAMCNENKN